MTASVSDTGPLLQVPQMRCIVETLRRSHWSRASLETKSVATPWTPAHLCLIGQFEICQWTCPVVHGENLYLIWKQSIDDAVTLHNHFANVVTTNFGDYPPQPRKRHKAVCSLEYPSGK